MTTLSLTEWKEGSVAAAANIVVAVAWDGDSPNVGAIVAAEPNQTKLEEADEPNRTNSKEP